MPNTPTYALPYPALTDAPNVPQHMQSLASGVESTIAAQAPKAMTTTTTSADVTFGAGWGAGTEGVRLMRIPLGNTANATLITVYVNVSRTGATISPDAGGNITDETLFTLPTGYRPTSICPVSIQVVSSSPATGRIGTDGVTLLQEMAPGGSITTGRSLRIQATYLVAGA